MKNIVKRKLDKLKKEVEKCKKCRLWKTRNKVVFGEGDFRKRIMLIGEAPGKKEDLLGKPFCGLAGKFLDVVLKELNLSRKDIFITSVIKCRPPKNRKPKRDEIESCKLFLSQQIEILKPKLIVLLGQVALETFFKNKKISNAHGSFLKKGKLKFFVTFHPAAGMRFPKIRKLIFKDLEKLKENFLS